MKTHIYNSYLETKGFILKISCNDICIIKITRVKKKEPCNPNIISIKAKKELHEYFSNKRFFFSCKYLLEGTDFQKLVFNELIKIPYGKTASYKDIAIRINKPNASRAVGNAVSSNNILIMIPCHRIIASNGALTGFSAGIDLKEKLLNIENNKTK